MGFWDKLRAELIDIIEWLDDSNDTLVFRFERYGNEIKYGSKLIVREGQQAIFVNEGKVADVFGPGTYELETKNLPILSTLQGWKYGFESPFKAEVYFVSTRQFTDLKWGTRNPIMMRDPEFGPIRLRAFGTYAIKATDPAALLREIVGTDGHFTTGEITDQLRSMIVSRFASVVAAEQTAALDMAGNYEQFGELIRSRMADEFAGYGLDLMKLVIENISLPPEVEKSLDKRTSMGVLGDLNRYSQFQAANALEKAAENQGAAGASMGMGMGVLMGNQMSGVAGPSASSAAPPPLPTVMFHVAKDGQSAGPYDLGTLKGQAGGGGLSPDTLVWRDGMAQWARAGDQPELKSLFSATPPPLPPGA